MAPTTRSTSARRNSDSPPAGNGRPRRVIRPRERYTPPSVTPPAKTWRRRSRPTPSSATAPPPDAPLPFPPITPSSPTPSGPANVQPVVLQAPFTPRRVHNTLLPLRPEDPTPTTPLAGPRPPGPRSPESVTPSRRLRPSLSAPSTLNRRAAPRKLYPGYCPICPLHSDDLHAHLVNVHAEVPLTNDQLVDTGLMACTCGKVVKGQPGLDAHKRVGTCRTRPVPQAPPSAPAPLLDGWTEAEIAKVHLRLAPLPAVRRRVHPAIAAAYQDTAERIAKMCLASPTATNLAYFHMLPKVGLVPALRGGVHAVAERLTAYPRVSWPEGGGDRRPRPTSDAARAEVAAELVAQGRLGTAARAISPDTDEVADPAADEVLQSLRSKHPVGPERPFGDIHAAGVRRTAAVVPDGPALHQELASFKAETAPGPSGWTVPLLRVAMRSGAVEDLVARLAEDVALGQAVGRSSLLAARLIPLRKPDGGVRPIAVGEVLYRLIMKALLRANVRRAMFLPCQFGVQTPGGVEPIVHAVRAAAFGTGPVEEAPYTHLLALDFSNAFNTLDRAALAPIVARVAPELLQATAWAYGHPSDLVLGDGSTLQSSQGVRQGCPLGPFLFSLGIQPVLQALATEFRTDGQPLAYLDDTHVLVRSADGLERAERAVEGQRALGLRFNRAKSSCTSLETIRTVGQDLLGSHIGSPASSAAFLSKKINAEARKLQAVKQLPAQCALQLLSRCLQHDLRHLQRTLASSDLVDSQWKHLDGLLGVAVMRLRRVPPEPSLERRALARRRLALPARLGGLGLAAHVRVAPHARAASLASSAGCLARLGISLGVLTDTEAEGPLSQRERCDAMYKREADALMGGLTTHERVAVAENASRLGHRWLRVLPWTGWLHLDEHDVAAGLRAITLHYPAASDGPHCPSCRHVQRIHHGEVCPGVSAAAKAYTPRHTGVTHALGEALKTLPDVYADYEPRISHDGANLRRDDLRLIGSPSCGLPSVSVDVTVVSLFTEGRERAVRRHLDVLGDEGLVTQAQTACRTVLADAAADKRRHRPDGNDGLPFSPFALSSGGILDEGAERLLERWLKPMRPFARSFMLDRIAVGLLRVRGRTSALWQ